MPARRVKLGLLELADPGLEYHLARCGMDEAYVESQRALVGGHLTRCTLAGDRGENASHTTWPGGSGNPVAATTNPGMVIDGGQHLAFEPIDWERPADDVEPPVVHRRLPSVTACRLSYVDALDYSPVRCGTRTQ